MAVFQVAPTRKGRSRAAGRTRALAENEVNHNDGDDSGSGDRVAMDEGGSQSGDNTSGDNNQGEDEQICTTSNLTTGTVVQEAELRLSSAGAVWDEVELVTP